MTIKTTLVQAAALLLALTAAGCGEYVDGGRSPARVIISTLEGASGAAPDDFGGTLLSDVLTLRTTPEPCSADSPCPTIFNDLGRVTMTLVLRDQGVPGLTATPGPLNQVTFTRYRVVYARTDGRNVEGVDVPPGFDSAVTFTVPNEGEVSAGFEVVRSQAKEEAPLRVLANSANVINTIATITFYGKDLAGNDVTVSGRMGVTFGNFADPQ